MTRTYHNGHRWEYVSCRGIAKSEDPDFFCFVLYLPKLRDVTVSPPPMAIRSTQVNRESLTTSELENLTISDLARLKLTDDEKKRLRLINEERARQRERDAVARREEQAPLLSDLARIGLSIENIWDLVKKSTPYPRAIPVLLAHLNQPYADRTREGIARALAVPDAAGAWPTLISAYCKSPDGSDVKRGLAVALAATFSDKVVDDLVGLLRDPANGTSRLLLLRALRKSRNIVAKQALEELSGDIVLSKEISLMRKMRH